MRQQAIAPPHWLPSRNADQHRVMQTFVKGRQRPITDGARSFRAEASCEGPHKSSSVVRDAADRMTGKAAAVARAPIASASGNLKVEALWTSASQWMLLETL
jgi:hypothetical protein